MKTAGPFVFLFPSATFGGHEQMACSLIEQRLATGASIVCFGPKENQRLTARLATLSLVLNPIPVRPLRLESLRAILGFAPLSRIGRFLMELKQLRGQIVLVQGDIETGSTFLIAAHYRQVEVISYLPYCHSFHHMKKPLGRVRDLANAMVYRCCHEYWTISSSFARQLQERNPRAKVSVHKNFLPALPQFERLIHRPPHEVHFVVVGRVYFAHKGQDLFLRALPSLRVPEGTRVVAHLVGDGPDMERARVLAQRCPPQIRVEFHGWLEGWWTAFASTDILIIPSRFEGVPLVMLEGKALGLRILAASRDGMVDYLDSADLYRAGTDRTAIESLRTKLQNLVEAKKPVARQHES